MDKLVRIILNDLKFYADKVHTKYVVIYMGRMLYFRFYPYLFTDVSVKYRHKINTVIDYDLGNWEYAFTKRSDMVSNPKQFFEHE